MVPSLIPSGPEQLRFASWNIRGGLSDPRRATAIADLLIERQDDVVALPDAWHEDSERSIASGRHLAVSPADFLRSGYMLTDAWFEENRPDDNFARFHFATLIRQDLDANPQEMRLGTRPAMRMALTLGRTTLNVICLYLNDQSKWNRAVQIDDLFDHLGTQSDVPTMLMGDFNDMHRNTRIAKLLQSAPYRRTLGRLPVGNYVFPSLAEMAEGSAIQALEAKGFTDIDPFRRPTMPSRLPLFQLDRFMLRNSYGHIQADPTTGMNKPPLSDHSLIATTLRTTRQERA